MRKSLQNVIRELRDSLKRIHFKTLLGFTILLLIAVDIIFALNFLTLRMRIYYQNLELFKIRRRYLSVKEEIKLLTSQIYERFPKISSETRELSPARFIYILFEESGKVRLIKLERFKTLPPSVEEELKRKKRRKR